MTIKELKELHNGIYADIEVYTNYNSDKVGFHTDRIKVCENYTDDMEVLEYALMGEEEYNSTICANQGLCFTDIYDKDYKILVLKVSCE